MSETTFASGSRWLLFHAIAVFVFLYSPIAILILYSFNGEGVGGFPPHHLTLDWYRTLFADGPIWDSVLNSVQVALAAMVISLAFGVPAALALERAQFPGKAVFRRLVLLPLILPGIITGLSLLMLFNVMGTKLSLMTIILGHGTALISVATTEVFAGLQKLDRAQEEASLDLGANYWQTFWRITVPNLKLPIIGAALLIFTLSMDEIAVSFFLIGRDNTLPLEIWGRLRRGSRRRSTRCRRLSLCFRWWRLFCGIACGCVAKARRAPGPRWWKLRRGMQDERESQGLYQVCGCRRGDGGMSHRSFVGGGSDGRRRKKSGRGCERRRQSNLPPGARRQSFHAASGLGAARRGDCGRWSEWVGSSVSLAASRFFVARERTALGRQCLCNGI